MRIVRDNGFVQTSPRGTLTFTFLRAKYDNTEVDAESVRALAEIVRVNRPTNYEDVMENPFNSSEIYKAIHSGGRNRAPSRDGIWLEFYKATWTTIRDDFCSIMNHMLFGGVITPQQKHGTILCLPKPHKPLTPADHRPITLLNTDYKIVAPILAHRLRPMMGKYLRYTQYCGVPGNTILDAVATVRDAIAHAENTNTPLCILTLDFKNALDRIAHSYIFTILHSYGLNPSLINIIRIM